MSIDAKNKMIESNAFKNITLPELKEVLEDIAEKYLTEKMVRDAIEVADLTEFLMRDDLLIQDGVQSPFLDLMTFAAFIHNMSFNRHTHKWSQVFKAREVLEECDSFMTIPKNYRDAILQCVEQQCGKHTPVDNMHPLSSTPQYHFAKACSLYYRWGGKQNGIS